MPDEALGNLCFLGDGSDCRRLRAAFCDQRQRRADQCLFSLSSICSLKASSGFVHYLSQR